MPNTIRTICLTDDDKCYLLKLRTLKCAYAP